MTHRLQRARLRAFSITALLLIASSLCAQTPAFDKGALTAKMAENKKKLEQYTYLQKTEVFVLDKLRTTRVQSIHYNTVTGAKIVTLVSSDPPIVEQQAEDARRRNGGIIRRAIQEKRDETKAYIERLTALMQQYLPPNPTTLKAAMSRVQISAPVGGDVKVAFANYVKPGDNFTLSVDQSTKTVKDVSVTSTLDTDPVTFHVSFSQLPDGTNYPGSTLIESPVKDIRIQVSTSDYHK
jgi:hypothetical protein